MMRDRKNLCERMFLIFHSFNGDSRIWKEDLSKGKNTLSYMAPYHLPQIGGFGDFFDDCVHNAIDGARLVSQNMRFTTRVSI